MTKNYNPRLETEIISGTLQVPADFIHIASLFKTLDFKHPPYGFIWNGFQELHDRGIEITPSTIENYLDSSGVLSAITVENTELRGREAIAFLFELPDDSYGAEKPSLVSLAKQMGDVIVNRELSYLSAELKSKLTDGVSPEKIVVFLDTAIGKMSIDTGKNIGKISDAKMATDNFFDRFQKIVRGEIEPYIETGLKAIDDTIGGLGKGKVILIAGTSGDGKTVLCQNILSMISVNTGICPDCKNKELKEKGGVVVCPKCEWEKRFVKSAFIKMEGKEHEAWSRFAQILSGVDALDIEKGTVSDDDMPELTRAMGILKNSGLIINASPGGMTMRQLKNQMIKLSAMGVEVILIDQLNNLELETDNSSYLDADKKGYLIKKWTEELDVNVIAIHQMNKGSNNVYRKGAFNISLADLAESGEKPMDAVFFVRHDEKMTLIMCVKARVGNMKNVRVNFDHTYTSYSDWDGGDDIPEEFSGGDDE